MNDQCAKLGDSLPARYTIESKLGEGGQGSIFLGTIDGQEAAIKVYSASSEIERIERELSFLTSCDHPNIVKVLSGDRVSLEGSQCVIVAYEYVTGGDLDKYVLGIETIDSARLAHIAASMASALEELWGQSRRVVHRDIKPANILESSDGRFVLADFGLARHIDIASLTPQGMWLGTPGYMSPEQAMGRHNLTVKSDVFSLGITLFEIAARKHPFGRDQQRIMSGNRDSLADCLPHFPAGLAATMDRMMDRLAHRRPFPLRDSFAPE